MSAPSNPSQTASMAVVHSNESMSAPLIQASGALLGIIVLILAVAWIVKRIAPGSLNGRIANGLKVSASTSLGARERVVIVNVEDARLVLGVTAQQISLLHTLPPAPAPDDASSTPTTAEFSSLMKKILKRTERT